MAGFAALTLVAVLLLCGSPVHGQLISARGGLAAWWPFNDSPEDKAGPNTMILAESPSYAAARVLDGIVIADDEQLGLAPASASLNVGTNGAGFTLEAWISPSDIDVSRPILEWSDHQSHLGVHFWISHEYVGYDLPGALYANIIDSHGTYHVIETGRGLLVAGAFQLVTLSYRPDGLAKIYLNGSIVVQTNLGVFVPKTDADLYLGYRPSGPPPVGVHFRGVIDEVEVFKRALGDLEVQGIYNAGIATLKAPAIAPAARSQSEQTQSLSSATAVQPLILTIMKSGDALVLNWSAIAGRTYQLQFKTSLNQSNWINSGDPVQASNYIGTAIDPTAIGQQRFYRVVLLP